MVQCKYTRNLFLSANIDCKDLPVQVVQMLVSRNGCQHLRAPDYSMATKAKCIRILSNCALGGSCLLSVKSSLPSPGYINIFNCLPEAGLKWLKLKGLKAFPGR